MSRSRPGEDWRRSSQSVSVRLCHRETEGKLSCVRPVVSPQSLLAQHKDFGATFEPLQKKLSDLQIRVQAENGLRRDLPEKQAQLLRLQVRGPSGPSHLHSDVQLCGKQPSCSNSGQPSVSKPKPEIVIPPRPLRSDLSSQLNFCWYA